MKPLLIVIITFVLGALVLSLCLFPLGWLIGRYPAESREIVPGVELCRIDARFFWIERISSGDQFQGRSKFNEKITGVSVSEDGKTMCVEFSGDLGVLYAVYPNRTGLVRPALWDSNGHLERWPDWLGYIGDLDAFNTHAQDPASGLARLSAFEEPLELLRKKAR
jgi:hypothetical protein